MELALHHFVLLSAFLFAVGVACLLTKRNAIGLLMGVELVLNAGNLNLVAAARYWPDPDPHSHFRSPAQRKPQSRLPPGHRSPQARDQLRCG